LLYLFVVFLKKKFFELFYVYAHTYMYIHTESLCATSGIPNSLPTNIREAQSVLTFRRHLKTYYFQSVFSTP